MAIELDAQKIRYTVETVLRPKLVGWAGGYVPTNVALMLSNLVVETMFEVAASTQEVGPEKGIIRGLNMIKTWQD